MTTYKKSSITVITKKALTPQSFSELTKVALLPISESLEEAVSTLATTNDNELYNIISVATKGAKDITNRLPVRARIPFIGLFFNKKIKLTPKELVSKLSFYDRGFDLIESSIDQRISMASDAYKQLWLSVKKTNDIKKDLESVWQKNIKDAKANTSQLALVKEGKEMMMQAIDNSIGKAMVYSQLMADGLKSLSQLKLLTETQRHELKNDIIAQCVVNEQQQHAQSLAKFQTNIQKIQQECLGEMVDTAVNTQKEIERAIDKSRSTLQIAHEASTKLLTSYEWLKDIDKTLQQVEQERTKILQDMSEIDKNIQWTLSAYSDPN